LKSFWILGGSKQGLDCKRKIKPCCYCWKKLRLGPEVPLWQGSLKPINSHGHAAPCLHGYSSSAGMTTCYKKKEKKKRNVKCLGTVFAGISWFLAVILGMTTCYKKKCEVFMVPYLLKSAGFSWWFCGWLGAV